MNVSCLRESITCLPGISLLAAVYNFLEVEDLYKAHEIMGPFAATLPQDSAHSILRGFDLAAQFVVRPHKIYAVSGIIGALATIAASIQLAALGIIIPEVMAGCVLASLASMVANAYNLYCLGNFRLTSNSNPPAVLREVPDSPRDFRSFSAIAGLPRGFDPFERSFF